MELRLILTPRAGKAHTKLSWDFVVRLSSCFNTNRESSLGFRHVLQADFPKFVGPSVITDVFSCSPMDYITSPDRVTDGYPLYSK